MVCQDSLEVDISMQSLVRDTLDLRQIRVLAISVLSMSALTSYFGTSSQHPLPLLLSISCVPEICTSTPFLPSLRALASPRLIALVKSRSSDVAALMTASCVAESCSILSSCEKSPCGSEQSPVADVPDVRWRCGTHRFHFGLARR